MLADVTWCMLFVFWKIPFPVLREVATSFRARSIFLLYDGCFLINLFLFTSDRKQKAESSDCPHHQPNTIHNTKQAEHNKPKHSNE